MEYLSPLRNSLHSAWPGIEKWALSLHLSLSTSVSTVFPLSLCVSGDLRQAVKSTHVSLTGSSIRAELRVTFTHLFCSDILSRIRCSFTNYIYLTSGQRTSIPMIPCFQRRRKKT